MRVFADLQARQFRVENHSAAFAQVAHQRADQFAPANTQCAHGHGLFQYNPSCCIPAYMALERCAARLPGELYDQALPGPDALRKDDESHTGILRLATAFIDATVMSSPFQGNSGHQAGNSSAHHSDFHAAPSVRPRLSFGSSCAEAMRPIKVEAPNLWLVNLNLKTYLIFSG